MKKNTFNENKLATKDINKKDLSKISAEMNRFKESVVQDMVKALTSEQGYKVIKELSKR